MKIRLVIVVPWLLIAAFVGKADEKNYAQLLVGTWGYLQKEDGTYWGYDRYYEDGTVHAWGANPETLENWEMWGQVNVNNNISCTITIKSSNPNVIPVGIKICDEIVSIDETTLIWRHQDGNMTEVERVADQNTANTQK